MIKLFRSLFSANKVVAITFFSLLSSHAFGIWGQGTVGPQTPGLTITAPTKVTDGDDFTANVTYPSRISGCSVIGWGVTPTVAAKVMFREKGSSDLWNESWAMVNGSQAWQFTSCGGATRSISVDSNFAMAGNERPKSGLYELAVQLEWQLRYNGPIYRDYSNILTVAVGATNLAPIAHDVPLTIAEDTIGSVSLSATDIDSPQPNTFELLSAPSNGQATLSGTTLTFKPDPDWSGVTSLTYRAQDTDGAWSPPATVFITVTPVNDAPIAQNKELILAEDTIGTVVLSATDIDSPPPSIFEIVSAPNKGKASLNGSTLTFTPDPDWNGATSLTYRARDADGAWSAPATVAITVTPVNDAPVALAKSLVIAEDTIGTVTLSATDIDSPPPSTFEIVSATSKGKASISGSTLTFTPDLDWNGATSLTYRARDADGAWSAPATVAITVTPVNDAPVALAKSLVIAEDTIGTVTLSATDIDSPPPSTFEIVSAPSKGKASISGSTLTFTPDLDWNGTTSLTYRARDADGAWSAPANVAITVTAVNDPPVAQAKSLVLSEDTIGTITLSATDIDSPPPSIFEIVSAPNKGKASLNGSTLTFTPDPDWNGATSLTYRARDADGAWSHPATVVITVTPVNDAPVAQDKQMILAEDTEGAVLLSATDIDSPPPTNFSVVSPPGNGKASLSGSTLTFTPNPDWNGSTSLTYRAQDADGAWSAPATVFITVTPVNDAPIAQNKALILAEDTTGTVVLSATDIDSPPPSIFAIDSAPIQGTASVSGTILTYTPPKDWNGSTELSYRAQDTNGAWSEPAIVVISVTWVNDAPASTGALIKASEGMISDHVAPWVIDVDTIYGDIHTFTIEQQPSNGSAKLVSGLLEYTPNPAFYGSDTFIIKATDSEGLSVEGPVTVEVTKFNYKPTAITPTEVEMYSGIGGTAELKVLDPNKWGANTLEIARQPAHGNVTISGMSIIYKTDGDADTSVLVRATDQDGLYIEQEVALNFLPAWDMFKDRTVQPSAVRPKVPAVKAQMTNRSGLYALQILDHKIIEALGSEIIAITTPDSEVGVTLQHRELAQGIGMRLVPHKLTADLLEARLGGLKIGIDGMASVYLSRADMTGPVYSIPVHVWAPQGSLTADSWDILQAAGRTRISFTPTNNACLVMTNETVVKPKNVLQDPACFITWTKTPDEWRSAGTLDNLMMDAGGAAVGSQTVEATAYVFDSSGLKHKVVSFSHQLNILPVADQVSFSLKPAPNEAYQKVQQLSLLLRHMEGPVCDPTASESFAKKTAQQWSSRSSCLIRWMQLPEGMAQERNSVTPLVEGAMNLPGANNISWKASIFTPSGQEIDIGYGEHTVMVTEPPAIEVEMPSSNLVKEGLYSVSQLGGYVGSASVASIAASLDVVISRAESVIERSTIPSYGRSQRFTRYIEGVEAPLWSVTPYTVDIGYTALPETRSIKKAALLAVPHDKILPVILNDERTVLDTVSLPIRVGIKDTRFMEDAYRLSSMGDWEIRLLSTTAGLNYEPMTNWEPIDDNGQVEFEVALQSLTNKAVRIIAEARVRSPVPEFELIRVSAAPMVLSVLNGESLDGSIRALRVIGPAPLRSTFYAVTTDRYQSGDLGEVRWEMSKDGGVTWENIEGNAKLPQRLSMVFQRGTYLLRAELTNRHSGSKSMTPTIEVVAYVVPVARLKGPANVFIGDSGTFTLTDLKGNTLDTTGMIVEWSEDRGKTWAPGQGSYRLGRDVADRVYLTARVKYSDSPEDKRVYKTLRAGVAFRPVMPPRVQIIGPRRPEVGKEATWIANLMMPYPKMDVKMDGEFILPDGTVIRSTEVKYTPTPEDKENEENYIGVRSWINGYEDRGGLGLTRHRLIFWSYDWPEWKINSKSTAQYVPADLTMTARALGLFREFEGLTIEWDIPPYAGLEMIKESNQTNRIVRVKEPGVYTFGAHITDSRGNYSYSETKLEFFEPTPWDVKLSWFGDNDANRAPLGVLIRPSITGGHPKDKILQKTFSLDGNPLPSSGEYGRATLKEDGVYSVKLDVATAMGQTATGEAKISVARNKPPVCKLEVVVGRTSWLAKANCTDEDGRMAKNLWFINGEQQALTSSNISVSMWRYPKGEPVITLVGIDNSGAESPPVSNK
ncbi:tandem-95 repeat protein [Pseudomonas sp. SDM007_2]|uniref:tandem-95 repeat protein n=1 Tax=Pseudomonas hygromyciniae TaxID=2812000 RepID=UPI001967B522|nr:Ig-like domain-containing protein [Pseudomonas hygromyciniae]MBN0979136.1 tandem-95 repeat protein [Pseudomonas hygromyciniae]